MTTVAQSYGTHATFNINATSWAQAVTISSDAVSLFSLSPSPMDVMITVKFTAPNSTIGAQKSVNMWISPSEDGSSYADNDQYSGANNTQTSLRSPTNFYGPFVIPVTQNIAMVGILQSLRALLGGSLPRSFGIILENQSNVTITAGISAGYTAINFTNS